MKDYWFGAVLGYMMMEVLYQTYGWGYNSGVCDALKEVNNGILSCIR